MTLTKNDKCDLDCFNCKFDDCISGSTKSPHYYRQYYAGHKKEIAESRKKYYEKNKEIYKQRSREYYREHKEEILRKQKEKRSAGKSK